MSLKDLFTNHIETLMQTTTTSLAECGFDGLVLGSGAAHFYFEDDQTYNFRSNHHFARWCPVNVPQSLVLIEPGKKPQLFFYAPSDYWHDSPDLGDSFWQSAFDIEVLRTANDVWQRVCKLSNVAYHGPDQEHANSIGLDVGVGASLLPRLNWDRSFKTAYEVEMLVGATDKAAKGHLAAKESFFAGKSEREIHYRYLEAVGDLESEMPYGTIIALDEKSAILHYTAKRATGSGDVFLIDAGSKLNGYASDITRTYATENAAKPFRDLLTGVDVLQQKLCAIVKPGVSFTEIHSVAHELVADLLLDVGVLTGVAKDEVLSRGLTNPFFPHGVGHMLGLLVHDVAGKQSDREGNPYPQKNSDDPRFKHLRSHRVFEPGHVFTIEPGIYFIPLLLDPERQGKNAKAFNWSLIDECMPYGGIRIEDNIAVTETGFRNITREFLP